MREINKYHVLETIRCFGQISRVEISERTLLSGTTVSAITAALIDEGLIEAHPHRSRADEGQRGRPRVLLDLIPDAAYVVGIKHLRNADHRRRSPTSRARRSPRRSCRSASRAKRLEVIVDLIEDAVRECVAQMRASMPRA